MQQNTKILINSNCIKKSLSSSFSIITTISNCDTVISDLEITNLVISNISAYLSAVYLFLHLFSKWQWRIFLAFSFSENKTIKYMTYFLIINTVCCNIQNLSDSMLQTQSSDVNIADKNIQ